jgi:hypothetical protein
MRMKKYKPEQILTLLRQIEVEIANGKTTPQACREVQITAETFLPLEERVRPAEARPGERMATRRISGRLRTGLKTTCRPQEGLGLTMAEEGGLKPQLVTGR